MAIPTIFFILMPLGFSIGDRLFGGIARPRTPLAVGIVKALELTDADSSPWIGSKVQVHEAYVEMDTGSAKTMIPRDCIKRIDVIDE